MAKIIPEFIAKNTTDGELDLISFLKKLPDDYRVYYTINVNNNEPDFIVVGKEIGVLIIEVKDWDLTYIRSMDKDSVQLAGGKVVKNPLEQARTYGRKILSLSNKYNYPVNQIVCFPNITYDDFIRFKDTQGNLISSVLDPHYVIFRDELKLFINRTQLRQYEDNGYGIPICNNKYVQLLQKKLYHTFKKEKHEKLKGMTQQQINLFSYALYPQFIIDDDEPMFKALEIDQILLAHNIPTEHELIRGNAGTGKSIILQAKALFIAKHKKDARILLIYYNKCIKSHLLAKKDEFNRYTNIEINHYDMWKITKGMYDYILIDEGQDFNDGMLKELKNCLKENGIMVIASDGAQNIYEREHNLDPNGAIKSIIDIKKDVEFLNRNYRTTKEIFEFANDFLIHPLIRVNISDNKYHSNYFTEVNAHFRHGEIPYVKGVKDFEAEYQAIIDHIHELKSKGERSNNICIIFNQKNYKEKLKKRAARDGITLYSSTTDCCPKEEDVFLYTRHSSKGLEFRHIIICGLEMDSNSNYHKSTFVAMTRAKYSLMITYIEDQDFDTVKAIKDVYQKIKRKYDLENDFKNRYNQYGKHLMIKMKTILEIKKITTYLDIYTEREALERIDKLIEDSIDKINDFQDIIIDNTNSNDVEEKVNKKKHIKLQEQKTEVEFKLGELERTIQVLNKKLEDTKKKDNETEIKLRNVNSRALQLKNELQKTKNMLIEKESIISRMEIEIANQENEHKDESLPIKHSTKNKKRRLLKKIVIIVIGILALLFNEVHLNTLKEGHTINVNDVTADKTNKKVIPFKSTMTPGKYGKGAKVIQSYVEIFIDGIMIDELSGYHQSDSIVSIEENVVTELVFNGELKLKSNSRKVKFEDYRISIINEVKIMYSNSYNTVMINGNLYEMKQLKELNKYVKEINKLEVGKIGNQIVVEYNK
ncbi:MAG: NERD domain-containing protein [Vallitalea sp.]|nr:NERD domain-containing protein [Vallitalea sp.]